MISNCLQSSLKNIKHVQLALVQKRKQQQQKNILVPSGFFPHPPTNHYGHLNFYSISSRKPSYLPGVSMEDGERRENSSQRLRGEGEGHGPARSPSGRGSRVLWRQPLLKDRCCWGGVSGLEPCSCMVKPDKTPVVLKDKAP